MTNEEAFSFAVQQSTISAENDKAQRDHYDSAIRESTISAVGSQALTINMKAAGAVESGKVGRALLQAKGLPCTHVKGNALCGMTTVALQTQGSLNPQDALSEIKKMLLKLNATEKTQVFKVSKLMAMHLYDLGGEEAYLREIAATEDTFLDAGQMLLLSASRGAKNVTFYHMDFGDNTLLTSFEVSLECMVSGNSEVGAIFINSGQGHWDAVCTAPMPLSREQADGELTWYLLDDGLLTFTRSAAPFVKEDPLKQYLLCGDAVMVRVCNFKMDGKNQVRDIMPGRVKSKILSIRNHGWLSDDCAHAIADDGVTVSDRKLILGQGVNEACLGPFDASHRIKAVRTLQQEEPSIYYNIPTMIYSSKTPRELWRREGFARMEINHYSDPYNTIDLLGLLEITVDENKLTPDVCTAEAVHKLLYGQTQPGKQTVLDIPQLANLLEFLEMLKDSNQFDLVVRTLGTRDHSSEATLCNSLLGNEIPDDESFKEGACFLAPVTTATNPKGKFLPFGKRNAQLFKQRQRTNLADGKMKELFLWAYGSWLLSGGVYPSGKDWLETSNRIKQHSASPVKSDLDTLSKHACDCPVPDSMSTLEVLAAQPGLLRKAAINLQWKSLLTGSRNSVVQ